LVRDDQIGEAIAIQICGRDRDRACTDRIRLEDKEIALTLPKTVTVLSSRLTIAKSSWTPFPIATIAFG
jgi:hypothetical protein